MSTTQERLDAYYAAEARILSAGFSLRLDQRHRQEAELAEIRKGIATLKRELAAEQGAGKNLGSLSYKTVVFNR